MMLCDFSCENSEKKWPINSTTKKPFFTEIFMRDGTKNTVALTPGIYPIKGGNGSGKSTLMNIILAYERKYSIFENSDLAAATFTIKQDNIRIIERDAVVFECLDNFNSQICGPLQMPGARWKEQIKQSIRYLLEPHLVKQWENIFMFLEAAYNNRKDQTLSSGEKVILSFMRFFASWNKQVSLLIIDECDTFLDPPKKRIFREALHNLASHMAIYISSHSGTAPT
jgi:ABC-type multidrug transport system ATPase subunit